jgi:hypothetical protein
VKKCETLNEKKKVIENYDKYDELIWDFTPQQL